LILGPTFSKWHWRNRLYFKLRAIQTKNSMQTSCNPQTDASNTAKSTGCARNKILGGVNVDFSHQRSLTCR
jgi:hypothetical protein